MTNNFDVTVPNAARVYDYLLDGKDHFQADRDAGNKLTRLLPGLVESVRDNRAFLTRAVERLADQGISQFIDIGSGLPTRENVHEVAQRANSLARTLYVDCDPMVVTHARALLTQDDRTKVMAADARDIDSILRHDHVCLDEPIAVTAVAILHFLPTNDIREFLETLATELPPGSAVAVTHACTDGLEREAVEKATALYREANLRMYARSSEEIRELFDERWQWQPPGLAPVPRERPTLAMDREQPTQVRATFVGGIAGVIR